MSFTLPSYTDPGRNNKKKKKKKRQSVQFNRPWKTHLTVLKSYYFCSYCKIRYKTTMMYLVIVCKPTKYGNRLTVWNGDTLHFYHTVIFLVATTGFLKIKDAALSSCQIREQIPRLATNNGKNRFSKYGEDSWGI